MATTKKKPNPFTLKDTPANEKAERKMAPGKAAYAKMEKKYEGKGKAVKKS